MADQLLPPVPERRPVTLALHGRERVDEYHWLGNREDPAVLAHLAAENAHTETALARLQPLRDRLYHEMLDRIVETDLSVPVRRGPWWYYQRTREGSAYTLHCRRPVTDGGSAGPPESPAGDDHVPEDEELLLDENRLAEGHGYLGVGGLAVSPDHRWLAYATDTVGDERYALRFRRLGTGPAGVPDEVVADEVVADTSYGLAWGNDNATVFYTRVDAAMRPCQLWRHRLGRHPADDVEVLNEPDERFALGVGKTKDEVFVVVELASTSSTECWVIPADQPETPPRLVAGRRPGVEYAVEHLGGEGGEGQFLVLTNDGARDFRLMAAPVADPGAGTWRQVLAERPGTRLDGVDPFSSWLAVSERLEAESRVRVVPLRPAGTGDRLGGDLLAASWLVPADHHPSTTWEGANPEPDSTTLRFEQTSLAEPRAVLELEVADRTVRVLKRQPVRGPFRAQDYRTFRIWATSGDGTAIPVSVVHHASLGGADRPGSAPGRPAPCVLYGYGAYEHSIDPAFSSLRLSLLERGFVFAIAHVRGGGELGRGWYEGGKLADKPHTFDDCIAVARHLIAAGFTTPALLALRGASAGGLLVGAVLNRAPELFAAGVAQVPFVDCLTTMCDPSLPLTIGEWEEWGNPLEDEATFALMAGYSPYDNIRSVNDDGTPRRYPDLLVTAGLNDPRVGYWEPAKWVARLRAANVDNRVLLRTEMGAGHGGPSSRYESWQEEALVVAFLLDALGVADDQRLVGPG